MNHTGVRDTGRRRQAAHQVQVIVGLLTWFHPRAALPDVTAAGGRLARDCSPSFMVE